MAGAPVPVAVRLAISMLAIQASIGALNDWVDAPRDAVSKSTKPIPAGLVTPREALAIAAGGAMLGIGLSLPSGVVVAAVLGFGLACGFAYDLWLSRTASSWLPLALALPVVPIHAWLGARGDLPAGLVAMYPAVVVAGATLALANGLVDVERDARSGRSTVAVRLGGRWAWWVHAVLVAVLVAVSMALAPTVPLETAPGGEGSLLAVRDLRALRDWGVALGMAALVTGAVVLRSSSAARRERGWELEAVGVAAAGIGWLAGIAGTAGAA